MNRFFTSILFSFFFTVSSISYAQPCIDGFSGANPCNFVDQPGHLPLALFQSENANDIWGWTSPETGREYALLGLHNKTAFIDITTPEYPLYLGYLPTATVGSLWRDLKVIDHYVFIGSEAGAHGMQIFDLRRLESLQAEDTPVVFDDDAYYAGFGNSHNIVADTANHFIYAVGSNTVNGGLHIIDVSDPLMPFFAGSSSEAGYVHDAQVVNYIGPDTDYQGRQIAIGFNEEFVAVYDVTDKTDVIVISMTPYFGVGYVHQGWLTEDMQYMLSNDETDELDFNINTRTIVWDMTDLDNPEVINYIDLGTTSIDHNLYIREDMAYLSNYTSGLRILDVLEIAEGELEPFGFYDMLPQTDAPAFFGTWSNYPYFKSGIVPTTGMGTGLHVLKPRYFELGNTVIRVCDEEAASLEIKINRRIFSQVNYTVSMEEVPGLFPVLDQASSDGAPAVNAVNWAGLNLLEDGYYPGEVLIEYDGRQERLPFVLVKSDGGMGVESLAPANEEAWPSQEVTFTIADPLSGYGLLQVSLDEEFEEIVYEENLYGEGESFSAFMPYDLTSYFWRIVKPSSCGDDIVSNVSTFTIDNSLDVEQPDSGIRFSIYPNPSNDVIYISSNQSSGSIIRIFDISGREVIKTQMFQGRAEVNVSALAPGLYVLRGEGSATGSKFIVR